MVAAGLEPAVPPLSGPWPQHLPGDAEPAPALGPPAATASPPPPEIPDVAAVSTAGASAPAAGESATVGTGAAFAAGISRRPGRAMARRGCASVGGACPRSAPKRLSDWPGEPDLTGAMVRSSTLSVLAVAVLEATCSSVVAPPAWRPLAATRRIPCSTAVRATPAAIAPEPAWLRCLSSSRPEPKECSARRATDVLWTFTFPNELFERGGSQANTDKGKES